MSKNNVIEMKGVILENLSNGNFRVELENKMAILCYLSGKMRMNNIKILPGDKVGIEMSPYDMTRGRIYRRF